jgi:hypothetical protein
MTMALRILEAAPLAVVMFPMVLAAKMLLDRYVWRI